MEPKSNLNNTQRKMLDKLFDERATKKIKGWRNQRDQARTKLQDEELAELRASKEYKELQRVGLEFHKLMKSIQEKGFRVFRNEMDGKVSADKAYIYQDNKSLKLEAFDLETTQLQEKAEDARNEVRARIYGMDTTYGEIDTDLSNVFDFLDN